MHITNLEEYGIRCALQLARHAAQPGLNSLQVSKIAEAEGLSTDYVAKIMHLFRKDGLICSIRGHRGGFALAFAPEDISLARVLDSLKTKKMKEFDESFCQKFTGKRDQCVHNCDCPMRPVWTSLFRYFDEVLAGISLADLVTREEKSQKLVESLAQKKAQLLVNQYK